MVITSFHMTPQAINKIDYIKSATGIPKSYVVRNAIETFRERQPFELKDYIDWSSRQLAAKAREFYKKRQVSYSLHPAQVEFLQRVAAAFGCSQSRLLCYIIDRYIPNDWGYKINETCE